MLLNFQKPLVSFIIAGLLVPSVCRADCTKDVECKGSRVCVKGACVSEGESEERTEERPKKRSRKSDQKESEEDTEERPKKRSNKSGLDIADTSGKEGESWHYESPRMRKTGIVFFWSGLGLSTIGGILAAAASSEETRCESDFNQRILLKQISTSSTPNCHEFNEQKIAGYVVAGFGSAIWVTGLILWYSGATVLPGPAPDKEASKYKFVPSFNPVTMQTDVKFSVSFLSPPLLTDE